MKPDVFSDARDIIAREDARAEQEDTHMLTVIGQHVRDEHARDMGEHVTGFELVTHARPYRPQRRTEVLAVRTNYRFGDFVHTVLLQLNRGTPREDASAGSSRNSR